MKPGGKVATSVSKVNRETFAPNPSSPQQQQAGISTPQTAPNRNPSATNSLAGESSRYISSNMILDAHNLGITFDDKWIFRNKSLSIVGGDRIAIVGPSGSGKSLLLRCIALLQPLAEGNVLWHGSVVRKSRVPEFRSRVIYVPQRVADADGTVKHFMSAPFEFAANRSKSLCRDRMMELFGVLGRDESFLAKQQRDLSGGERQIAALVRAMLLAPEIILLDEPTSAMDGATSRSAERLILDWCTKSETRAFVWVTHDIEQSRRVSNSALTF